MLELFHKLGLPEIASAHGAELDEMLGWVHWLMLALFIGWGAFFIYTLIRFRASKNPKADYVGVKSHLSTYLEGAVAVIEVVLIIGFAMPLWTKRVNQFPPDESATTVRVVAEQFAWNIHYPGKDGQFGKTSPDLINLQTNPLGLDKNDEHALDDVTIVNQMHLPVNKPVLIYLSSKDVIHSFGIPEMRVKQDAIPGMVIPVWFTPTVTTAEMKKIKVGKKEFETYEIACAQLCGMGHYRMKGMVTVETQTEFDQWFAGRQPTLGSGSGDDDLFG